MLLALNLCPHRSPWPQADLQTLPDPGAGHSPARLCDSPVTTRTPGHFSGVWERPQEVVVRCYYSSVPAWKGCVSRISCSMKITDGCPNEAAQDNQTLSMCLESEHSAFYRLEARALGRKPWKALSHARTPCCGRAPCSRYTALGKALPVNISHAW